MVRDDRDTLPKINYESQKRKTLDDGANTRLILYSIPSTCFLITIGLPFVMPRRMLPLIDTPSFLLLLWFGAPLSLVFSIAALTVGREHGHGFALWYSIFVNSIALVALLSFAAIILIEAIH